MKLKHAAVLASVLLLAACGAGKQEGEVRFLGFAPVTSPVTEREKDVREIHTYCPSCGDPIAVDTNRCPNKRCKAEMTWAKEYRCPSCKGSKICAACSSMEQANGDCYNCKGQGVLIFQGQSPECPNCKGTKKCPICKGSMKCDYCEGTGVIVKDVVKAKSARFAGGRDDNDLPPSDPKDLPKKDDMPKDDAKKDAPPETKKE